MIIKLVTGTWVVDSSGARHELKLPSVVIPEAQLQRLRKRDAILSALEAGGVDNWEWYGDSINDHLDPEFKDADDD